MALGHLPYPSPANPGNEARHSYYELIQPVKPASPSRTREFNKSRFP